MNLIKRSQIRKPETIYTTKKTHKTANTSSSNGTNLHHRIGAFECFVREHTTVSVCYATVNGITIAQPRI